MINNTYKTVMNHNHHAKYWFFFLIFFLNKDLDHNLLALELELEFDILRALSIHSTFITE